MTVRVGIIGFGKLGLLHAGMMNGLTGSRLECVIDPSSVSLGMLKSLMPQLKIYSSHKEVLFKDVVDAVFICTPTNLHVEIAKDFLNAGIAVFIEKPLSVKFHEAKMLSEIAKKTSVVNMVGYMSRYQDTFRKAKEILNSKALGKIQTVHASMYIGQLFRKGKGWRYSKSQSGGGVLITQNSHLLDMLIWLFGDIKTVSGNSRSFYSEEVEDWFHGFLEFKAGHPCIIDTSWSKRHHRTLSMNIEIQAENGTLSMNEDELKLFLQNPAASYPTQWTVLKKPDLFEGVELDIGGQFFCRQADDFIKAVNNKKLPESNIHSAAKVQSVIDSLYNSAAANGLPLAVEHI